MWMCCAHFTPCPTFKNRYNISTSSQHMTFLIYSHLDCQWRIYSGPNSHEVSIDTNYEEGLKANRQEVLCGWNIVVVKIESRIKLNPVCIYILSIFIFILHLFKNIWLHNSTKLSLLRKCTESGYLEKYSNLKMFQGQQSMHTFAELFNTLIANVLRLRHCEMQFFRR